MVILYSIYLDYFSLMDFIGLEIVDNYTDFQFTAKLSKNAEK